MTQNRFALYPALVLALAAVVAASASCAAVKYKTSGTYVDGAGGQHPWSINDSHTLIWDSQPYVPVGVSFTASSISQGAPADSYQADTATLDAIKAKGITDIVLKGSGPITSCDPAALQRIIDYLDANGFRYGIEMDDGPRDALRGYLISPNRYRLEGPSEQSTIDCNWPNVDSAIYVVVNTFDNSIKTTGGAVVRDGKVTISLAEPLTSSQVLIVYPRKAYANAAEGGISDIWSGFGEYRDRVLDFFKKVKPGPGMRFFLEPFTSKMDFSGEMAGLVPDSKGFRLGLEAYLTKRYTHEGSLNAGWGLNDNLNSIEEATRLMPLWSMGRGVSYVYDRASAKLTSVDPAVTRMWRDIIDYRDTSAQEYMNTISDTLRKQVANVPVIFKGAKYHRIYANPYGMGGFDGVQALAYGTGESPLTEVAGPMYALAEECGKSTWFIAAGGAGRKAGGYPGENAMASSLDSLREIGCKGFFVDGISNDATQIEWLAKFGAKIKPESLSDFKPMVIDYPIAPSTGAGVKRLARDTWWLPTLKMGSTSYIGDGLFAYAIAGEDKVCMWSGIGPKTVTLKAPPAGYPSVVFPTGADLTKRKGNLFTLTLTDTPTVLRGMDIALVFPNETAEMEIDKLQAAILEADKAGLGVKKARDSVDRAKNVLKNGQSLTAYGIAQQSLQELLTALGSDVWLEGEQSPANNFDGTYPMQGASGSQALLLDNDEDAPLTAYSAAFIFDGSSNSSYEIWLAGTPPSESSPVSYSVEGSAWTPVAAAEKAQEYAPGLSWYKIGTVNLAPGKHSLKFRVDGRRSQDNRYYFAIDAIVLSPRGFKPDGVMKPF